MRVLVTRPRVSADKTARLLKQRGHEPLLLPLTEAVSDVEAVRTALETPFSALALTSAEAVRVILSLRDVFEPFLDTPVFAVGAATGQAAREAGFSNVLIGAGDGAALASLVQSHAENLTHPLLYLAGFPRAAAFEQALAKQGLPVRLCECYRMVPVADAGAALSVLLKNQTIDAALFYSAETVRLFFALAAEQNLLPALKNVTFACLGRNVAASVPEDFQRTVVFGLTPDEQNLLDLL